MHQSIQQKRAILDVLRQRATQVTAETHAKLRYTVVPHGNNLFGVVDRETGVERIEVAGHMQACQSAQKLEDEAGFTEAAQLTASNMARWMLRWTAVFCLMIAAFAFFGAHP